MLPFFILTKEDECLLTGNEVRDYFDKQLHISYSGVAKGLIRNVPHSTITGGNASPPTKLFKLSDIQQ